MRLLLKKLWNHQKLTLLGLSLSVLILSATAAGVNAIYNHVTSATGYQVAGSAGSSGQALCSDGTNYDTPCNVGPGTLYYQTVDANATAQTQRPILNLISGTGATVSCVDNSGATRTDCTVAATSGHSVTQSAGLISSDGTSGSRQFYSTTNPMTTPPASPDIYQNTTSGPLLVTVSADGGGGGFHGVVYCDSSTTPSTNVGEFGRVNDGSSNPNYYPVPIHFIVAPGYYFGISVTSGGGTPIGSNARDTWTEWTIL